MVLVNWMATCRRMQMDTYLSSSTKHSSEWIKDLNIRPDTLNPIKRKKTGNSIEFIETEKHFLNETPLVQALTSATINGTSQN